MTTRELALDLAGCIAHCHEVEKALGDAKHPCHKIVTLQGTEMQTEQRQRPEPWFGNLHEAKILFISSNPSINEDPEITREQFPVWAESQDFAAKFFVDRVGSDSDAFVTFNHPKENNFLMKSMDGKFRNSVKQPNTPQFTWNRTHQLAQQILGDEASPITNYAITEVVHCKSKAEKGVKQAAPHCSSNWMGEILRTSPAQVVIIVGTKARESFAAKHLGADELFGKSIKANLVSPTERAFRDICISDYEDTRRLYMYVPHPAAQLGKQYQEIINLYPAHVVDIIRSIAEGETPVPNSTEELHRLF